MVCALPGCGRPWGRWLREDQRRGGGKGAVSVNSAAMLCMLGQLISGRPWGGRRQLRLTR